MAVAQTIETHAVEVETAEQVDPAGIGIGQRTLRFRYIKKREGGTATIEPLTDQRQRPFESWKDLGVQPSDFNGTGGLCGNQPGYLALPSIPRRGDIYLRRQLFGLSTFDTAPVGIVNTERYRDTEHDGNIVIRREVAEPSAQ